MLYEYLEDIALADVAFRAWSESLEGLFRAAAEATLNVMVEDLETVQETTQRHIQVKADSVEMLLFEFLAELVFWKDADQLLLRVRELRIEERGDGLSLFCTARGEAIDPLRHPLLVDVKAVTLHRLSVHTTPGGWEGVVVLDI